MSNLEVNQKTLADCIGVTGRRVRQLREEGLFERDEKTRKYNLEKCVREYIDFKVKAETGNGKKIDREIEQAEHERYKKEITILKLRKMKRELHEAGDIELYLSNMLINFKNRLLSIPAKVAGMVVGEEDINIVIDILQRELYETLEELSEYDPDEIEGVDSPDYTEEDEDEDDLE